MMNIDYSIPDLLCKDSPALFVGVNLSTSNTGDDVGHYFAGPKNQFFCLLHASGKRRDWCKRHLYGILTQVFGRSLKNTGVMVKVDTELHHQYRLSFTNYVKKASKTEKSLTAEEMVEGKQRLMGLIDMWQPQVVCFLGLKCIKQFLYTR